MSNEIKQQLSAMMDGELDRDAARFLCKRLESDAEMRDDWSRWHVARDCLSGHFAGRAAPDLVARVAAAIEQESAPSRSLGSGLLRWAAGAAVAASVAVMAILAVPNASTPNREPANAAIAAQPAATGSAEVASSGLTERDLRPNSLAPVAQTVSATQSMSLPPAVQVDPRVEAWVLRHNAAALQQQDSFVPYIQLVSPHRPQPQRVVVDNADAAR